jgi:hypothetical protein
MILDDLRVHITEHCLDEKQADVLMQKVDAISQMINRLLQLRVQSKVKGIFRILKKCRFFRELG